MSEYSKRPPRDLQREFERQSTNASRLSTKAIQHILKQCTDEIIIKRLTYEMEQRGL